MLVVFDHHACVSLACCPFLSSALTPFARLYSPFCCFVAIADVPDGHIAADLIPYEGRLCVIIGGNILSVSSCSASGSSSSDYSVRYCGRTFSVGPTPAEKAANGDSGNPNSQWPPFSRTTARVVGSPPALVSCPLSSSSPSPPLPISLDSHSSASPTQTLPKSDEIGSSCLGSLISHYAFSASDPRRGIFMADAAQRGDIELMRLLRTLGCTFAEGERFVTKISFAAALHHHLPLLEYLSYEGVILIKEVTTDGNTLAHIAASQNNVPLLDLIYSQWKSSVKPTSTRSSRGRRSPRSRLVDSSPSQEAEVDETPFRAFLGLMHNNRTPSMIAGLYRHLDTLKWLKEHGDWTLDFSGGRNIGVGILHLSIENGDLRLFQWLLASGFPLTYRSEDGNTLATLAARYGKVEMLEHLESLDLDIRLSNYAGESPFLMAASYGRVNVMEWMFQKGYSISDKTNLGRNAIHVAAAGGQLSAIEWLDAHGLDIHEKTYLGYTPACMAAKEGHLHILKWLHAHGAQLNDVVVDGTTPLLHAAFYGHLPVLKWLHRIGYSLADRYQDGMTVVHTAAVKGHGAIVKWLASKGHSMIERTDSGLTPAALAYAHGNADIWMWLRENGLDT